MIISEKQIWEMMEYIRSVINENIKMCWIKDAAILLEKIACQQSKELKEIE